MVSKRTTLSVSAEVWQEINKRKTIGDSVDDVLRRIFDLPVRNRRAQ